MLGLPMDERRRARGKAAHRLGLDAEYTAARLVEARGLTVLERRYRTEFGEIDLIAREDNILVFIEVKARRTRADAAHALTARQWARLEAAALHYLSVYRTPMNSGDDALRQPPPDMRFDVILVDGTGQAAWMENARRFDEW